MASLRDTWKEEGSGAVLSRFMDSETAIEDLTPEEKSWIALAFAVEGWHEEAIDTVDTIDEPSAQGECARAIALRGLGKPEEANDALRRSIEIEEHLGRKEHLASWLRADAERNGEGKIGAFDSENETVFGTDPFSTTFDYGHSAYDEPKALLRDCLNGGEEGSSVVDRAAVKLAQMGEDEEEVVKTLKRGIQRGSSRSKFELAVVQSYFAPETPDAVREGVDAVFWPKALEVLEGLPRDESDSNKASDVYELYIRFAAAAYQYGAGQGYPETLLDVGFDLIQHTDDLDVDPGEIALLCGRAAFLSGDLEIAKMFYREARDGSEPLSSTTVKIEEAVVEAKDHSTAEPGLEAPAEKIVEAAENILNLTHDDIDAADSVAGIESEIINGVYHVISVQNLPLLQEAIDHVQQSSAHSERNEGIVQSACSRALAGVSPFSLTDTELGFRERNAAQGALKCDHPQVSFVRNKVSAAQGRYGKAVVEAARRLAFSAEDREEVKKRASFGFNDVKDALESEQKGEAPKVAEEVFLSFEELPHEQSQEGKKARFEGSHQTIRQFVEGEIYSDEINESLRPPILKEVCLTWEILIKKGLFDEQAIRKKEAADAMQAVGDQKGDQSERAIWVRGVLLRQESMLERQVSNRKDWAEQRSLLESAQMIDSGLKKYVVGALGYVSKILGDLETAGERLQQLIDDEVEASSTLGAFGSSDSLRDRLDLLKTAPDRWSQLKYYPKKLLAALTALDGRYTEEQISDLSGQKKRFISGHIETLLEKGMLERSEILGPIWIDGVGGVRVNPFVEDFARRERSHEVQSRLIEADDDLKARQVFDSDGEYRIYQTLTDTFPNGLVFPNMSPSAIFDYDEMQEVLTGEEFRYFLQSRVDFCVVSTDSYLPVLAIEVDSHFHDQDEQKKRDHRKNKIFKVGGVPLIRLRRFGDQSQQAVANQIQDKIQELVESNTEEAKVLRMASIDPPAR